jgi:hypothetical protein
MTPIGLMKKAWTQIQSLKIIGLKGLADGTFPTAKRLVPKLLDACPTKVI